ncbi:hypothetical protein OG320_28425 [Microbispora sp. NBC_01189]|nr:hypothetical protein OG320_28425 [Microbispora sp. NBC_01189]
MTAWLVLRRSVQLALLLACGVTLVALTVRTPGTTPRDDLPGTREQSG